MTPLASLVRISRAGSRAGRAYTTGTDFQEYSRVDSKQAPDAPLESELLPPLATA